jgi:hypothetical protein
MVDAKRVNSSLTPWREIKQYAGARYVPFGYVPFDRSG